MVAIALWGYLMVGTTVAGIGWGRVRRWERSDDAEDRRFAANLDAGLKAIDGTRGWLWALCVLAWPVILLAAVIKDWS